MAAEMLEKILEAEKTAKEQLCQCEAKANEIVEKATEEGKAIINQTKLEAESMSKAKIDKALEDSKVLLDDMFAKAKKSCDEMEEKCHLKSEDCAKVVADKLFS